MVFSFWRYQAFFHIVIVGLGVIGSGCVDPLREEAIWALGEEAQGIAPGPLHRAGQPCLVCHDGGVSTPFSVAGTIQLTIDGDKPAVSALVQFADGLGTKHVVATNCAGNFFVRPGDFDPIWPLWVRIESEGWTQEMESPVNLEGSCASCHAPLPSSRSAGPVYVYPFESEFSNTSCP